MTRNSRIQHHEYISNSIYRFWFAALCNRFVLYVPARIGARTIPGHMCFNVISAVNGQTNKNKSDLAEMWILYNAKSNLGAKNCTQVQWLTAPIELRHLSSAWCIAIQIWYAHTQKQSLSLLVPQYQLGCWAHISISVIERARTHTHTHSASAPPCNYSDGIHAMRSARYRLHAIPLTPRVTVAFVRVRLDNWLPSPSVQPPPTPPDRQSPYFRSAPTACTTIACGMGSWFRTPAIASPMAASLAIRIIPSSPRYVWVRTRRVFTKLGNMFTSDTFWMCLRQYW